MNFFISIQLLFMIFLFSCGKHNSSSFQIREIQTYPKSDSILLDLPQDIAFHKGILYVLDAKLRTILVFDARSGNLLNKLQFSSGRGPGEFNFWILGMELVKDSVLVLQDLKELEIFTTDGRYLQTLKLDFRIDQVLNWNDSLLLVNGGLMGNNLLFLLDLKGNIMDTIDVPFHEPSLEVEYPTKIIINQKGEIYAASPYQPKIIKMDLHGNIIWEFHDENKSYIEMPQIRSRGKVMGISQMKGWSCLWEDGQFLYASTFNITNQSPHNKKLVILDNATGNLKKILDIDELYLIQSFPQSGKFFRMILGTEGLPYVAEVRLSWR